MEKPTTPSAPPAQPATVEFVDCGADIVIHLTYPSTQRNAGYKFTMQKDRDWATFHHNLEQAPMPKRQPCHEHADSLLTLQVTDLMPVARALFKARLLAWRWHLR